MSFPKNFKRAFVAFVAMLALVASGVGFGLASASAVTQGQLEATNFVVTSPQCGQVQFSWDYVGGPDDWFIDRDAENNGPTVASGSVATAAGSVAGIVATSQPAGTAEYFLYGSRGGIQIAKATVVVGDCTTQTDKVWVCKVVGGPGHYSLKEGKQPIEVSANALGDDVQPIVGAPFSDAQPSFVVASDDRALCEAGLPPVVGVPVTPIAPTSVDKCGVNNDTYTVPSRDGVVYKVDGAIKAAGTYQGTGTVTVTAHPANDTTVLEGKTSWTFKFTNVPCQPDPVIAPKASLSSECEILDGEKSGFTVVNALFDNTDSSEEVIFEVAEDIDGVTEFYQIPVAAGEEITPQVFYSEEDGKTVSLVINARDVALATLSFDTTGCAATVTPPPPPPTKVCPVGTKWVDLNSNGKVDNGECKTPVMHKPPVVTPPVVNPSTHITPRTVKTGDESPPFGPLGLGGMALVVAAGAVLVLRRKPESSQD